MREPFDIRARQDMYRNGMEVVIFQGEGLVTNMVFETLPRDRPSAHGPTLSGPEGRDFLQAALNCAWEMGLRPAGLQHTTETIAATARHLEDMRAIAFTKLNVEKPNG